CEGRRIDEITNVMNISQRTIFRDLKWCRKNLKRKFTKEILEDIIFDSYRRRVGIWSKLKELVRTNSPINQIISTSKHLLELDNKIVYWFENAKTLQPDIDKNNLEELLAALDKHIKGFSDDELRMIINDPKYILNLDKKPVS
ncbi:hypothetical protein KKB18_05630, partial [bacterium]|nr:hypothetical protein [bacterium]